MGGNDSKKLVGILTLKYDEVEAAVNRTNELLASIGKNVNLDMTKVVEKQVKSSLDAIVKELQKKIDAMQSAFSGMTLKMPEFDKTRSMVEGVMQISTAFDEAGKASGQIVSGFDRAGNKIKEVYEDGQRIKTTIVEIGGKASEINKVNEH